jgi:hypothetical protein
MVKPVIWFYGGEFACWRPLTLTAYIALPFSIGSPMRRTPWPLRRIGRSSKKDVLDAFRIVSCEIRSKRKRFANQRLTQAEACTLALRIRDQRELVRDMFDRRDTRHAKRLLRLNGQYRRHLIELVKTAGLDAAILVCK